MPFYWIVITFAAGIATASVLITNDFPWLIFFLIALVFSLILILLPIGKKLSSRCFPGLIQPIQFTRLPIIFLVVFFTFGGLLFQSRQVHLKANSLYQKNDFGYSVQMTGIVCDAPDNREKLILTKIRLSSYKDRSDRPIRSSESIMIFLPPKIQMEIGDKLTLNGYPITPMDDEEFSYKDYLASQGIFTMLQYPQVVSIEPSGAYRLQRILYRFREKSLRILADLYPMPESALVQGILLGNDNQLPAELKQSFQNSGTSHIIAISGFNIAIIAGLAISFFGKWFGKWKGAIAALFAIILYTILVGASPSVVRAAIMGSLSLAGILIGRRNSGLNTLSLTAAAMLAADPYLLWSVSFQLSVTATLGLVLFGNYIQTKIQTILKKILPLEKTKNVGSWIGEYLFLTLATQITTIPVLLFHFHQLPLTSLLANPVVLPAQPLLMTTSLLALALAWISPGLGQWISWISLPFISYTIHAVTWFGSLNFPYIQSDQVGIWLILTYYLLLTIPAALPGKIVIPALSVKPAALIILTGIITSLLIQAASRLPKDKLQITISGPEAESILIQTPDDQHILINGQKDRMKLRGFLDSRLPFYNRRPGAIIVLPSENSPDGIVDPSISGKKSQIYFAGNPRSDELATIKEEKLAEVQNILIGDRLEIGDGILFELIFIGEKNSLSTLSWASYRMNIAYGDVTSPLLCQSNILISDKAHPECTSTQVIVSPGREWKSANHIDLTSSEWVKLIIEGSDLWIEVSNTPN